MKKVRLGGSRNADADRFKIATKPKKNTLKLDNLQNIQTAGRIIRYMQEEEKF